MGDPRKIKRKYSGPSHPWEATRIKEEARMMKEYGLGKKKEIWKARSLLSKWHTQARKIISLPEEQRPRAESLLISKLARLGVIKSDAHIDDILALTVRDVLERRLQTQLYKQGFTNTINQARQFIIHKKVLVDGKKIAAPTFLVSKDGKLSYTTGFAPSVKKLIELAKKELENAPKSEHPIKHAPKPEPKVPAEVEAKEIEKEVKEEENEN